MNDTEGNVVARTAASTPGYAALLCAFADTLDVDVDADPAEALPDAAALTSWLRHRNLLARRNTSADARDLELAIMLRGGLREAMRRHHDRDDTSPVPELNIVANQLPLQIVFDGIHPRLVPAVTGAKGALAWLLIAIAEAQAEGNWDRVKLCAAEDCLLAFYDTSKNRSRHWCSMRECGNRQKTRAYRDRKREDQQSYRTVRRR